jgi:tRNA A58 N-methylase Trm61
VAELAGSRLKAGARVFDLGAHQAVVALMLSQLVGHEGEVIALEAERHNFEVAERNRKLNAAGTSPSCTRPPQLSPASSASPAA